MEIFRTISLREPRSDFFSLEEIFAVHNASIDAWHEAGKDFRKCRFPSAVFPYNNDFLARIDLEVDIVQYRGKVGVIFEREVF